MSKIALEGNSLGSGTFTIAAPNSNSNPTLTLPTSSGTVVVTGGAQTIEFAAGTAASPSITFTGDTNTGIFSPGADTIAFSEGGTEAMRIDSSGNVGIGTSSLGFFKFKVSGTGGVLSGNANFVGLVGDGSASNKGVGLGYDSTSQTGIVYGETASAASNLAFWTYSGSAWGERMRIDSSGNVGIGTSSPSYKVDIQGSTGASLRAQVRNTNSGTGATSYFTLGSDTGDSLAGLILGSSTNTAFGANTLAVYQAQAAPLTFWTNNTERMRIDSSGNVGIGTTSPGQLLDVSKSQNADTVIRTTNVNTGGSATAQFFASNGTNTTQFYHLGTNYTTSGVLEAAQGGIYNQTAAGVALIAQNANGIIRFASGGTTERARITSAGYLLVGTTSNPSNGMVAISYARGTTAGMRIQDTVGSGGNGVIADFYNSSGTSVGSITHNSSNTTYGTSSDYRLKENVQPMTGALARVAALKPCTYRWKETGIDGEGFIAHELQAVVPDAVVGEKDAVNEDGSIKPQSIDTSFLVATLTAAIQELKTITDAQATRIEALEAEVAALKGQ